MDNLEKLRWVASQLRADAADQGISQGSEGARYCDAAANEIESLRQQLSAAKAEIEQARTTGNYWKMELAEANKELASYKLGIIRLNEQLASAQNVAEDHFALLAVAQAETARATSQKNAMWFAMEKQAATIRQMREAIGIANQSPLFWGQFEQLLSLPDDSETILREFAAKVLEQQAEQYVGREYEEFFGAAFISDLKCDADAIRSGEMELP